MKKVLSTLTAIAFAALLAPAFAADNAAPAPAAEKKVEQKAPAKKGNAHKKGDKKAAAPTDVK